MCVYTVYTYIFGYLYTYTFTHIQICIYVYALKRRRRKGRRRRSPERQAVNSRQQADVLNDSWLAVSARGTGWSLRLNTLSWQAATAPDTWRCSVRTSSTHSLHSRSSALIRYLPVFPANWLTLSEPVMLSAAWRGGEWAGVARTAVAEIQEWLVSTCPLKPRSIMIAFFQNRIELRFRYTCLNSPPDFFTSVFFFFPPSWRVNLVWAGKGHEPTAQVWFTASE